jgi:diaminopimelate epimerase
MTGGQLIIDIDREGDTIKNLYLTGPTNMVCCGEVLDDDLVL